MPNLSKLDLQKQYPCPCCHGQLAQLVLTEAFGCDKCQKIFVIQAEGYVLEQISTLRTQRWHWNGQRWKSVGATAMNSWRVGTALLVGLVFIGSSWYFLMLDGGQPAVQQSPNSENQGR